MARMVTVPGNRVSMKGVPRAKQKLLLRYLRGLTAYNVKQALIGAINDLEENDDLKVTTDHWRIACYLSKAIEKRHRESFCKTHIPRIRAPGQARGG